MATGGDQFECPICLETLMNPRILSSCGHSYCSSPKNCLKGIIQSYSRQCPECRTPIEDRVRNEKHCVENFTLKSAIAVKIFIYKSIILGITENICQLVSPRLKEKVFEKRFIKSNWNYSKREFLKSI